MRRLWLAVLLLIVSCTSRHPDTPEPAAQNAEHPNIPASREGPGFLVDVSLSSKARQKLIASKETVVVAGYLSGNPKPSAQKKYVDEMGEVNLGTLRAELAPGENAEFSDIKLKQDAFEQTDKNSPQLLINVFSGRKSSKNNLLDCGIFEGTLESVQERSIPISCKLIGE